MSTPTPVIFDDGSKALVPQEKLSAALKDGGKVAQAMQFDDGSKAYVPLDRVHDAIHDGGMLIGAPPQPPKIDMQPAGITVPSAGRIPGQMNPGENVADRNVYEGLKAGATVGALPLAASAGLPALAGGVAGGAVGEVGGRAIAKSAGAGEFGQELAGDAGGVVGGVAGDMGGDFVGGKVAPYAKPVATALGKTFDIATFDRIGKIWDAWKELPEEIRARGPQFVDPGGKLPETPPQELLQARGLAEGAQAGVDPSAGLGKIPVSGQPEPRPVYPGASLPAKPPAEVAMAKPLASVGQPVPKPQAAALGELPIPAVQQAINELGPQASIGDLTDRANDIANGNTIPRTLSGESALRQVLTGQDNTNLLKIARGRGINVTQEAQLKPGVADGRIIGKIIDDFSPEELKEISDQFLENSRFRHAFGDIGPEAWKTMSLQTYFPDLKIPAAKLTRTAKAIASVPAPSDDLTGILQQSLAQAKARP